MKDKNSQTKAFQCFGVAVLLVLLCSCLSFNIGDWPSSYVYPHNKPTANWCGFIGAFFAYYLLYYVGPGVFTFLVGAIFYLVVRLMERHIDQIILRSVGLGLVTVAASGSFYCFWPHSIYGFPMGSGGILGVGVIQFLRGHFAWLGTFILVTSIWFVGFILLADDLVFVVLGWLSFILKRAVGVAAPTWVAARRRSEVLAGIWRRLSARQKLLPQSSVVEDLESDADKHYEQGREEQDKTEEVQGRRSSRLMAPKAPAVRKGYVPVSYDDYTLPPLELLDEPEHGFAAVQGRVVKAKATALEGLLGEFNVSARVVAADTGPVVTMFELELAAGVKVSQISSLSNDMARALGVGAVRVVAPLPGKHTIGVEVPNSEKEKVRMKDMLQLAGSKPERMQIPLFLGKDSSGEALVSDLTEMPHLLIAGTTGSGKSVCISCIIASILLMKRPDEVKMILIDPKMVEMTGYSTIPHLMAPIVTETQQAVKILEWATVKMDERYSILAEARVKNISEYNKLGPEQIIERFAPSSAEEEAKIPKRLHYIVIVIDELADLMMMAAKEIEAFIVRLAQKSRAVGIHIVLATQRPQATVVTGLIKANMPTRIGFRVAAKMDSRIILDQNGAETLLGEGDMLFLKPGTSDLVRAQGTFVDEQEIKRIVKHLKDVAEPQFHPELTQLGRVDTSEMAKDELFDEAVRIVLETKRGSVSLLQRRLNIGYARASRVIEMMASMGILGEYKGSQAREVIVTLKEYERLIEQMEAGGESEDEESDERGGSSEPSYITEGQKGYVSVEEDDEPSPRGRGRDEE